MHVPTYRFAAVLALLALLLALLLVWASRAGAAEERDPYLLSADGYQTVLYLPPLPGGGARRWLPSQGVISVGVGDAYTVTLQAPGSWVYVFAADDYPARTYRRGGVWAPILPQGE